MTEIGTTTVASGGEALERLLHDIDTSDLKWNEAETRFRIIDRIIEDCLGWPKESIRLEQPQDGTYSDYELGDPRCAIWEAKRQNHTFELPADPKANLVKDLKSIAALDKEASGAVTQVQSYCSARGVELAVATNGHQFIAFLATRSDGIAPLEGRCLVINGYEQLRKTFPKVWQMLSPSGVAERHLNRLLNVGPDRALPQKLSSLLPDHHKYRYPSPLQNTLRSLGELLLIDVDQEETEKAFYEQCYCASGALPQHALVSKHLLTTRYAALFDRTDRPPTVTPVQIGRDKPLFTPELMTESVSQRPIVLIGDVGVGKTSFLKHLMYVSAFDEFQKAIYIYIDLGSKGALAEDLNRFVLTEIETQLYADHKVDVTEDKFVRGIYHAEISRFNHGIYGSLRGRNPKLYEEKLLEFLGEKIKQHDAHLKKAISHIALGRKKQVIFVLDNADQRDYDVQQTAFIIAQNLANDWNAAVFIAVRPQTFYKSKQAGSLTAYPHRVFTIAPPRVDEVMEKRLKFALSMAEGRIKMQPLLQGIEVHFPNIAIFLKALIYSLSKNEELVEFLSNITAGNIRAVVEFVTKFIGSPNVNAQKIIDIMESENPYLIPVHEFWKAALLGEYSHYDPQSSLALNVFDANNANPNEHFLSPMILGYLNFDGEHRSPEGFVSSNAIVSEMQEWGFTPKTTEMALRRANNKKLIETPQRVTFDEDESGLIGDMPEFFRITTIGAYHLLRWIGEFSYLDAMLCDTPIFDGEVFEELKPKVASFKIEDRFERANTFGKYLTRVWRRSKLSPRYFDWLASSKSGEESFRRVKKAIERFSCAYMG